MPALSAEGVQSLAVPLLGVRPPRARRIPVVRRRVPVVILTQATEVVKIRHAAPNLGSRVSEIQPAQSQRV